ncbi:uncharacterized protein [Notamacropus eugenii]|uniref:uncharacterized protein n=1 Tax=Notamacropus eugenii TaxID=9315 RepID=UPI003B67A0CE
MKKKQWMFPIKANLVQFPPKDHQEKPLIVCPPLRMAPSCEGKQRHKIDHISYAKHQPFRTKLSHFLDQRGVTPMQPSNTSNRTAPGQLSYLDNQSMAKLSLDHKQHVEPTVFPLLYPKYKARTTVDLAQPEQFRAPPFSSTNLYEAPLDPAQQVDPPSGPEHLPKILQACDYQKEELVHFSQQSTPIPCPNHLADVVPCSYSQTKAMVTPLTFPSHQTKVLTNSKPWARTTTLMSENLNQPQRVKATPLPCLDSCSRATAVTVSDLNPRIKSLDEKSSENPPKLTASLQDPDYNARARATSPLLCSHCSNVINCSPFSKPYVLSPPSLVVTGKAITLRSSDTKLQGKPKPSTSKSVCNRHNATSISPRVSCHQTRTLPDPNYKSKELSTSLPRSNLQAMSSLSSENSAKISSSLKNQFINSPETSHWVEALPRSNCCATPRTVSSRGSIRSM